MRPDITLPPIFENRGACGYFFTRLVFSYKIKSGQIWPADLEPSRILQECLGSSENAGGWFGVKNSDEAHMAEEKRERIRYDVRYAVLLKTPRGTGRGVTRNLSGTGACICCRHPLKPNETFVLDIEFPGGPPFQVPAQVIWVQRPDPRDRAKAPMMGVRFMY